MNEWKVQQRDPETFRVHDGEGRLRATYPTQAEARAFIAGVMSGYVDAFAVLTTITDEISGSLQSATKRLR